METKSDPYTSKSMPIFIKINKYSETEPFIISLNQEDDFHQVDTVCKSVLNLDKNASISLNSKHKRIPIDWSFSRSILPGEYSVSLIENTVDIEQQYQLLKSRKSPIPQDLSPIAFLNFVFNKNMLSTNFFQLTIEHFLYRAILDVLHSEDTPFHRSLLNYLSPNISTNLCFPSIVSSSLINVISTVFDECIFDSSKHFYSIPESLRFLELLTSLLARRAISYSSVRSALSAFRPSLFIEYLVVYLAASINSVVTPCEAFRICEELFKTKWLFHVFRNPEDVPTLLISTDICTLLPYLQIYGFIHQFLKGIIDCETTILKIESIGLDSLISSERILKSIVDPFIDKLYSDVLRDEDYIPYLEMTKEQLDYVEDYFQSFLPILIKFIGFNIFLQVPALRRMHILFRRHSYEPKGITAFAFSFIFNNGVVNSSQFSKWFEELNRTEPASGIILEIGTILNPFVKDIIPLNEYFCKTVQEQIDHDKSFPKEPFDDSDPKFHDFNIDTE